MNKKELLEAVTNFAQTIGVDMHVAFRRYIAARRGEIRDLKEKIKKEEAKIKRLDDLIELTEVVQRDFIANVVQEGD